MLNHLKTGCIDTVTAGLDLFKQRYIGAIKYISVNLTCGLPIFCEVYIYCMFLV